MVKQVVSHMWLITSCWLAKQIHVHSRNEGLLPGWSVSHLGAYKISHLRHKLDIIGIPARHY